MPRGRVNPCRRKRPKERSRTEEKQNRENRIIVPLKSISIYPAFAGTSPSLKDKECPADRKTDECGGEISIQQITNRPGIFFNPFLHVVVGLVLRRNGGQQ